MGCPEQLVTCLVILSWYLSSISSIPVPDSMEEKRWKKVRTPLTPKTQQRQQLAGKRERKGDGRRTMTGQHILYLMGRNLKKI